MYSAALVAVLALHAAAPALAAPVSENILLYHYLERRRWGTDADWANPQKVAAHRACGEASMMWIDMEVKSCTPELREQLRKCHETMHLMGMTYPRTPLIEKACGVTRDPMPWETKPKNDQPQAAGSKASAPQSDKPQSDQPVDPAKPTPTTEESVDSKKADTEPAKSTHAHHEHTGSATAPSEAPKAAFTSAAGTAKSGVSAPTPASGSGYAGSDSDAAKSSPSPAPKPSPGASVVKSAASPGPMESLSTMLVVVCATMCYFAVHGSL